MQEGYINLNPAEIKNLEARRVCFNDVLWKIFQGAAKFRSLCHDFMFTFKGRPIKDLRGRFEEALRRAKIDNFWFHDLRRTFNTNMRKAKMDQTVIMKLKGHKIPSMFNRYNTMDQEEVIDAVKKVKSLLVLTKIFQKFRQWSDGNQ